MRRVNRKVTIFTTRCAGFPSTVYGGGLGWGYWGWQFFAYLQEVEHAYPTNAFSTTKCPGVALAPSVRAAASQMRFMSVFSPKEPQIMMRSVSGFSGGVQFAEYPHPLGEGRARSCVKQPCLRVKKRLIQIEPSRFRRGRTERYAVP